jgi:chromate transport protein ChrA
VLADALRTGEDQRTAVVFYAIAFAVTALTFNATWQYVARHRLLSEALQSEGATAISGRFRLAVTWLATAAVLGAALPVRGVAVIVAFNIYYWLPIRGESPSPQR